MSLRREKIARQDTAIERLLVETGYKGSTDPYDPHRQLMELRLIGECPWMTFEDRQKILEKGESPYKIGGRDGRHGWGVKIKAGDILIERWNAGKRDERMEMRIPLADWPTTTHAWRPNLAYAQHVVLWGAVTAMYKRVFVNSDLAKSPNMIQVTHDCDAIRSKIRELVADDWPDPTPAKRYKGKAPKPPKPKVIATPGEAERIAPSIIKFGVTLEELHPDYLVVPPPTPTPPLAEEVEAEDSEDAIIVLRKSALRGLVAEFDALHAEVDALRKQQQDAVQP